MNPIPEPDELLESECNAQGLYGLPEAAFARSPAHAAGSTDHPPATPGPRAEAPDDDTGQGQGD